MTKIYLSSPDVGEDERNALIAAFDSGWVAPAGPELAQFESELSDISGMDGVVAMASGTAALHLALQVSGVQPGDRVFVSDLTFAATANAVAYVGAEPVFIDSDESTWNMSPELLADAFERASTSGTLPTAVIVVDIYGQCADYDAIRPLCAEYEVPIIEDAAEALGSRYRGAAAGSLGDMGVFSFNGNKIITTSGGGAFLSSRIEDADRVRYLATQARQPVVHYEHTEIGYNYRLSNLLAALGRAQLARLPSMIARRREINEMYRSGLQGRVDLEFMPVPSWSEWNGWLTCVLLPDEHSRDLIMKALDAAQIESRPLWKPMHAQPVFESAESHLNGVSSDLFARGLCLPSGSCLRDDQIETVISTIVDVAGLS